jgi:phosphoribosyl-AMP cyclohydrolase
MVMKYVDVEWSMASCIGTDTRYWYADKDSGFVNGESAGVNRKLRRICRDCDILNDCATYSIEHELYGFWAGMTEDERVLVRNGKKTQPYFQA